MNKKTIRIIHISPFPFISGGIDTWLNNFLSTYNDSEYNLVVYCPKPNGLKQVMFDEDKFSNVQINYVGFFSSYSSMVKWSWEVFNVLRKELAREDTLIVLSTIPTMLPVILLKFIGHKCQRIICSVRGNIAQDAIDLNKSLLMRFLVKFVEGFSLRFADRIISNGRDTSAYLEEFYSQRSTVIPNGVNLSIRADSPIGSSADLLKLNEIKSSGKKILLHVGTVRKIKGIDFILEGYAGLPENIKQQTVLVFVGKGMLDHYSTVASELHISPLFLGQKSNVSDYYSIADLVINVSGGSGVSNSLIEALHIGTPVLAWDKLTFSQVIAHGKNGILCEYLNSAAITKGMDDFYIGKYSFEPGEITRSVKQFEWDHVKHMWSELLKGA